jgi:flavodoxin
MVVHQVIYFSRGGNTKKMAEAIADEFNSKAQNVKQAALGADTGILFLGSGCYRGKPGPEMLEFIESNELNGRGVALFGTSGGGIGKQFDEMEKALRMKGAHVRGKYSCKGRSFILMNRGRPNEGDLAGARKFARDMV